MSKKNLCSMLVLFGLIILTAYAVFKGNDMHAVAAALRSMQPLYVLLALAAAVFFVSAEGMMIYYLLHSLDKKTRLDRCICYSFVGFFFSGITPSATGGQPAQLYCMSKDGLKIADSTVVLMTVATIYKFVLVVMGILILIFSHGVLGDYLGNYEYLYYLGLALNIILVVILLMIMCMPGWAGKIAITAQNLLVRMRILKPSEARISKIEKSLEDYHAAVRFFVKNWGKIVIVTIGTVIQRCSVFLVTALIYRGFGLDGTSFLTVMILQATIYIAVDMLPLPGSQGITELMYKNIFIQVFPAATLTASLCVTRSVNFYFLLIVSAVTVIVQWMSYRRKREAREQIVSTL